MQSHALINLSRDIVIAITTQLDALVRSLSEGPWQLQTDC